MMKKRKMLINALDRKSHINREIYGHFSEHLGRCIYNGIYVGEGSPIPNTNGVRNDVIEAFREIQMPVLRWPGGCFADEYHWKDGIGDKARRKKMINTHWGGVVEDNSFGTHEFFNMCEEIGCEPYLAGNVGSGTVQELSEWIEYITSDDDSPMANLRRKNGREKPWKLKYLGVGNENWGCGGKMHPEFYTNQYLRYSTYCRNYGDNQLFKVACGPDNDNYHWTDQVMRSIGKWNAQALSLHYYTVTRPGISKGSATDFTRDEYYTTIARTLFIDELIRRHTAIMTRYDPDNTMNLIIDEWGCWFDVEPGTNPGFLYQQNTMRDAIVAAVNLNIFNQHSDRVIMANLAQAVNVLQAVLLTDGEKLIKTPTYHIFNMFKTHQDAELVYSFCENENVGSQNIPAISQSVSVRGGQMTLTIANCSLDDAYEIDCDILHFDAHAAAAQILIQDPHAYNDAQNDQQVVPAPYEVKLDDHRLTFQLPACSVVSVVLS